jgi:co-chaperonin GroES (HSP10)
MKVRELINSEVKELCDQAIKSKLIVEDGLIYFEVSAIKKIKIDGKKYSVMRNRNFICYVSQVVEIKKDE